MIAFGKMLVIVGLVLLLAAWRMENIFLISGLTERLMEEGGTLNYSYHLERDRMIASWVGGSSLVLGLLLFLGGRRIARNEADAAQESDIVTQRD